MGKWHGPQTQQKVVTYQCSKAHSKQILENCCMKIPETCEEPQWIRCCTDRNTLTHAEQTHSAEKVHRCVLNDRRHHRGFEQLQQNLDACEEMSELSRDQWIADFIFFIFGNFVGTPTMAVVGFSTMARTTPRTMAQPRLLERMNATDSFKPCRFFSLVFRLQAIVIPLQTMGDEDGTPYRTHHRRTFSRVLAHVKVAQNFLPTCDLGSNSWRVSLFESAFSQKSSCRHVFHRNLLCVLDPPPLFPAILVTESGTTCADPRRGSWFGWMAEQSPLTSYEPNRLIEISSQHTPINFPARFGGLSQKPIVRDSWLHNCLHRREVSANPFSVSFVHQAAAIDSQLHQVWCIFWKCLMLEVAGNCNEVMGLPEMLYVHCWEEKEIVISEVCHDLNLTENEFCLKGRIFTNILKRKQNELFKVNVKLREDWGSGGGGQKQLAKDKVWSIRSQSTICVRRIGAVSCESRGWSSSRRKQYIIWRNEYGE